MLNEICNARPLNSRAVRNILLGLILLHSGFIKGQDCDELQQDLKAFLVDSFPVNNPRVAGNFQFEKGTEIEFINSPLLDSLTGFVFYKTRLTTGMYEYYNLSIIAGVDYKTNGDIRLLNSPTYTDIDTNFLKIFYDIELKDEIIRTRFINELSNLFAVITYEGKIGMLENDFDNVVSFELWHGDLSWRIFDIYFNSSKLTMINIQNGVSRFKMKEGYKRLDE